MRKKTKFENLMLQSLYETLQELKYIVCSINEMKWVLAVDWWRLYCNNKIHIYFCCFIFIISYIQSWAPANF